MDEISTLCLRSLRIRVVATVATCTLAACTATPTNSDSDTTASATAASETSGTSTTTTSAGGGTLGLLDGGAPGEACEVWSEDCMAGLKCMPYAADEGLPWNSLKCVPVVPDPDGVGAPCSVVGGIYSGEDTCEEHAICFYVDPVTLIGTCVAMCAGPAERPSCSAPDDVCIVANGGVLIPCVPQCDPLADTACPKGQLCLPRDDDFLCSGDADGDVRHVFDPCEFVNLCEPGLTCAAPDLANECDPMAPGCCLPFCDVDELNTCPGEGQECVAWYASPDQAASFNGDVGLCQIPGP